MNFLPHIGLSGDMSACDSNFINYINRNFLLIDTILQLKAIDFVDTLPVDPEMGDTYILESSDYYGGESVIIVYDGTKWVYIEPKPGFIAFVEQENDFFWFNGTDWVLLPKTLGDVNGPNSSLNNSIARFDGVTGKWITDSGVILDNDRVITQVKSIYSESIVTNKFAGLEVSEDANGPDLPSPEGVFVNLIGTITDVETIGIPLGLGTEYAGIYAYRNLTGGTIVLKNSADIITGTGSDLNIPDGAAVFMIYSPLANAWIVAGGPGGGSGGILTVPNISARNAIDSSDRYEGLIVFVESPVATNFQLIGGIDNSDWVPLPKHAYIDATTLSDGFTLTPNAYASDQTISVAGDTTPVSSTLTPFGSGPFIDGLEIMLIGGYDLNPVTIVADDDINGVLGYDVTLIRGQTATYKWDQTLERFLIKSVSN